MPYRLYLGAYSERRRLNYDLNRRRRHPSGSELDVLWDGDGQSGRQFYAGFIVIGRTGVARLARVFAAARRRLFSL